MNHSQPIIAHRGASAYAPENTLAAFRKSTDLKCDSIEFDVMLSADGVPFVFHDESLKRTTNGVGQIGQVSAEYLHRLDAGGWFSKRFKGEKIPLLVDVLQWCVAEKVSPNIEIKPYPGTTQETAMAVLSAINQTWPNELPLPLVSSFDYAALKLCASLSPELPLGLLVHKWDEKWFEKANELGCYSIHINYKLLTENRVAEIKEKGFKVLTYTVNSKSRALKLLSWGVDSLFSDYPDLLA